MERAHATPGNSINRLREAGLTVKERKCAFGCGTCVYLGHVVGGGTIKPMECKVIAVKEFQQQRSKKDVRAFLALCGYYRKFIKQFSTIATPLTELTRKSMTNKVKWDSRFELTFSMLKSLLTQAPILSTPDWSKPFLLQTNASAVGLGYVLSQINKLGEEHPIIFASKKLSPPERNYST